MDFGPVAASYSENGYRFIDTQTGKNIEDLYSVEGALAALNVLEFLMRSTGAAVAKNDAHSEALGYLETMIENASSRCNEHRDNATRRLFASADQLGKVALGLGLEIQTTHAGAERLIQLDLKDSDRMLARALRTMPSYFALEWIPADIGIQVLIGVDNDQNPVVVFQNSKGSEDVRVALLREACEIRATSRDYPKRKTVALNSSERLGGAYDWINACWRFVAKAKRKANRV